MPTPQLFRVILPVPEIEAAAAFYGHVFQQPGERVSPGRHYFDCGGIVLACYCPSADGDEPAGGWQFHDNQYLYFSVTDLEAIRVRIEEAGGKLLTAIEKMPWGETMFYAVDPHGARLSFVKSDTLFTGSK